MVLHGFVALALRYIFAVVLISRSIEAQAQVAVPKTLLKAGINELATPARIPKYLIVNYADVSQNEKFWDVLLALTDLLDSMASDSDARDVIMMAACDWVKASTASATEQFDCEQYSSWSALGAIIRVIKDSGTIDEDLQLRKIPTSTKWEEYVKINTAAEPNDLVNDILELLVQ